MKRTLIIFSVLLVSLPVTGLAQAPSATQEKNYVDLLRKDIKREKVAITTDLMNLLPDESAKFWPVYNEYDKELTALTDQRLAFLQAYGENYYSMTDNKATEIANGLLDLEGQRNALRKKYFQRVSQTLNPKVAARFLQVETLLNQLLDLQVNANLPLFRTSGN
jgi:hypothetical protein